MKREAWAGIALPCHDCLKAEYTYLNAYVSMEINMTIYYLHSSISFVIYETNTKLFKILENNECMYIRIDEYSKWNISYIYILFVK